MNITSANLISKEPYQMTRTEFLSYEEYEQTYRSQYVNSNGEKLQSSRFVPSVTPIPPIGTWRIIQTAKFDKYGDAIEQLREIPVEAINTSEDTIYEGREGDATRYAQWLTEGQPAPPIPAVELENGKFQIRDGHRRLLAHKKAGRTHILAWVAPIADTGRKDPQGKMIPTDLTHQLSIKQALTNNLEVSAEVLADYPHFKESLV